MLARSIYDGPESVDVDRGTLSLHGAEVIYFHLLAGLLISGWLGLVLGELGRFSVGTLAILFTLVAAATFFALRRTRFTVPVSWSPDVAGLLPALLAATVFFTPPYEVLQGGLDPGVYVNTAANIARTGSIVIHDADLAALSRDARASLFRDSIRTDHAYSYGDRLYMFHITDLTRGVVEPWGLHLYPTVLAIAYSLGGIWALFWAMPVMAILALTAFCLLVRRLFGSPVAALAGLLLVVNPAVPWFARYPVAESLVQLWLLAGLLAFVIMWDTRSTRFAILAGAMLGAVHLTKIEEVVLPVVLAAFFLHQWLTRRWRGEYWCLIITYLVFVIHAVLHAHFVATFYSYYHLDTVVLRGMSPQLLYVELGLAVVVLLGLLLGRRWLTAVLARQSWHGLARRGLVVGLVLLAAYAYYLRPRLGAPTGPLTTLAREQLVDAANSLSFVILGWYVTPLGLLLGTLGCAAAITSARSARALPVLSLAMLETAWLLYDARVTPVHFWAARRYLPMVFPAFAMFGAYGLWRLWVALRGRWPEVLAPLALGCIVFLSGLGAWMPFVRHVEYRGAVEQYGRVAARIPERSVVLFDDSDLGRRLSAPLQYIWGRSSFILWKPAAADDTARKLLSEWLARGRQVYWVREGAPPNLARWGFRTILVGTSVIDLPEVIVKWDGRPDAVGPSRFELWIYQVVKE